MFKYNVGDIVYFSSQDRLGKIIRILSSIGEVEVLCLTSNVTYYCTMRRVMELNQ